MVVKVTTIKIKYDKDGNILEKTEHILEKHFKAMERTHESAYLNSFQAFGSTTPSDARVRHMIDLRNPTIYSSIT